LFEKLIGVSGIGPKLAVTVLSGLAAGELIQAIRNGAIDQLVRIPGVGKKTAERMILELRDKLMSVTTAPGAAAGPAFNTTEEDVLSALLNLGCARPAAEVAIRKAKAAGAPPDFEAMFRRSLELVR
jgi:holliday junction DNA helicase RuvA